MLTVFVMTLAIFIICQFTALLPLVTSQVWLRSDVFEPQPGYNYWRKPVVGFEYCDVITLASREFRVLLAVLPTSLRCLHILASSGSQVVATSPFFPTLTVYCCEVPFWGF